MYNDLTELLLNRISEYDENIKFISNKIREIKAIYDILKPSGKNFKIDNSVKIVDNPALFDKLIQIIKKNNYIVVERMIKNKIEYHKYIKETAQRLQNIGLSREILYSDKFLRMFMQDDDIYKKLVNMKELDEKLKKLDYDISYYVCNLVIEMYERLYSEKEEKKSQKKKLEYAYKQIRNNEKLMPKNIVTITNLINELGEDEELSNHLFSILNDYIDKTSIKEETKTSDKVVPKTKIRYTDLDEQKEVLKEYFLEDELINNYLMVLKSFNSFDDVNMFLDSICHKDKLINIVSRIINLLTDSDEDVLLKQYLLTYLENQKQEETSSEDTKDDITVLYYGFTENKNRILSDIEKGNISKDYYHDILKGIELIKQDGALNKRENFTDIKKLFKIRINDIRITFKRLTNNLYIIIGVFCKKDNKGYDVVRVSKKRNYNLLESEKALINACSISGLWDDFLSKNKAIDDEIYYKLSAKKKS